MAMHSKNDYKNYNLIFDPQARKKLQKLESQIAQKIDKKIQELINGAKNLDIKKMQGREDTYRLRCGDYRIIYKIEKHIITIIVIEINHRKDAYKD